MMTERILMGCPPLELEDGGEGSPMSQGDMFVTVGAEGGEGAALSWGPLDAKVFSSGCC